MLPDNITLADKDLVAAARAAYDKITSDTQRGLVNNYEKLRKAEQKISDLEYIQNEQKPDTETETTPDDTVTTDPQRELDIEKILTISSLVGAAISLTLAIVFITLYINVKKKMKKTAPEQSEESVSENTDGADA